MRRLLAISLVLCSLGSGAAAARGAEPVSHPAHEPIVPKDGQAPASPLKGACGVAVDPASGFVFVSSYYEHTVFVLNPKDEVEERIDIDESPVTPAGKLVNGPCDLAVDSEGNLYVNRWHYDVLKLSPLKPGSPEYGPATVLDSGGSTGVAVGAADRVYVDDRTYVAAYDSSGAPVLDGGGEPLQIGLGSLGSGYGVAVSGFTGAPGFASTAGLVYVADAADDTVKVFDPSKEPPQPPQVIDGGGTPQLGFSSLRDADLAVDPADGHLYVVDNLQPFFVEPEAVVDEFSSLGHFRGTVPTDAASGHPTKVVDGEPSAIAIAAGNLYLTSGNYFDDKDEPRHAESRVLVFGPGLKVETGILAVAKTGSGAGTVFSSSPAGLGCGSACAGEFTQGITIVLTATAGPHSRFAGWVGCTPLAGRPSQCQVPMTGSPEVSAEFEAVPRSTLTVTRSGSSGGSVFSAPAGLDCGDSCEASFDEGSTVTLVAEPAAGGVLAGWTGCDSEPVVGRCVVGMSAARAVDARFDRLPDVEPAPPPARPPHTLAVSIVGTGSTGGTVVSEPAGIDCGATCARTYADDSMVTLRANPATGSKLLGWGGCDSSSGATCTVALSADKTVVAAFGAGARGALRARKLLARGVAGTLRVSVPAAGVLVVSGKGLLPREQLPLRAGRTTVPIRLNEAGRGALRHARGGKLKRTLALAFTPFDGGDTIHASAAATFERRGRG